MFTLDLASQSRDGVLLHIYSVQHIYGKKKESSFDYVCCAVSDGGFFPQLRSADTVIDYFPPPPTSFSLVFLLLCYVTNCTYIFYI